jgi:hypothetical protein
VCNSKAHQLHRVDRQKLDSTIWQQHVESIAITNFLGELSNET